ncbi:MAG: molybdopterin-dependent oxidoreductase [Gemmatimonadota bacterium]
MSEGLKRRDFLKVLGVGGAGASLVGCSTEKVERLIPYVVPPEEITPGIATWYASTCGECAAGCGIWVRTREGRAVKLEGNPNHPLSRGALCSRGHASLQGLYNPDRITAPLLKENGEFREVGWDEALELLEQQAAQARGRFLLLSGKTGPSLAAAQELLAAAAGGRRVEYEALSEAPLREAARIAFGTDVVPTFDFASAGFILSFGADFMETWLSPVEYQRGFSHANAQDEGGGKAPFVFLGSRLSLTGQNADEWVPIRPGSEAAVALALANVIAREGGDAGPYQSLLQAYDPTSVAAQAGVPESSLVELARRFMSSGPGLAVGPGVQGQHRHATAANLAVLVLNAVAGSVGRTVHLTRSDLTAPSAPFANLQASMNAMQAGEVGLVMVHGTNPAYSLPTSSGFQAAFAGAGFRVALAQALDETASLADLVLPESHPLECWGDSNPRPGVWALQQPVMQPVPHFQSRPAGDVILGLAAQLGATTGADNFRGFVQGRWSQVHAASSRSGEAFDAFWREALRSGVVETSTPVAAVPALRAPDVALSFDPPAFDGDESGLHLVVYPSPRFGDGRSANRPWLQELPDPVSKIAWHSWVEVHPETGAELGLREGDMVQVRSAHGEVEVPVWLYPGIRRDTVALSMGSGHEDYGRYADGQGVNAMTLLPTEVERPSGALVHMATRVTLEPTGSRLRLATIEGSSDQSNRNVSQAVQAGVAAVAGYDGGHGTLQELQGAGGFAPVPTDGSPTAFPLPGARHGEYDPEAHPRWAMAIDLDKCTGCSACITACQSENNVPVVGEANVRMGRDMGWIRLERFYDHVDASAPGYLDIRHLPMLCQHCGNAPCEPVCPVYAAYHTPEGLNAQVYNRCVGTRYCANNCPYKVRVFNWHRFTEVPEPLNWQYNPDVTVRSEGVMEKCSFCVQRIREAQNRAVLEGRGVRDGDVVPACQQSCPAEAIVFGNIRDPQSRVAQLSESERTYRVLDDLINTQPAVNYLKKVTLHPVESGGH